MSTESIPADAILEALQQINARLDALEAKIASPASPASGTTLEQLAQRLDRIEASVALVGQLSERVPVLADAAGTSASWAYDQAVEAGIDPIEAGQQAARLALRAGQPEMLELAEKLIDQAPTLKVLLDAAESIPAEDLATLVEQGAAMSSGLAALLKTPELARLLDSSPRAVGVAESASTALVETRSAGADPVGPIGALFAMRDPDVQRAVGFSLAVARRFGQKLA